MVLHSRKSLRHLLDRMSMKNLPTYEQGGGCQEVSQYSEEYPEFYLKEGLQNANLLLSCEDIGAP